MGYGVIQAMNLVGHWDMQMMAQFSHQLFHPSELCLEYVKNVANNI